MRLVEIFARNIKPIKLAHVTELSGIVVIAGPNGVGKTRLINDLLKHLQNLSYNTDFYIRVEATTDTERTDWGKSYITTNDSSDINLLRNTLQRNRRRSKLVSSFLSFESNRSITNIQPFNWDWNFGDPFLEEVGWNIGLNNMTQRFQDVVHSIFRKIRSRRESIALHVEELVRERKASIPDKGTMPPQDCAPTGPNMISLDANLFPDALAPFREAFSQLLAPKELLDPEIKNQQLFYRVGQDEPLAITSLSSGEREVLNIAFDFLLRSPSDSVIILDEPELHLHPELSYRLLQTLRRIGGNNQFIFCTHSAEIITASLQDTVVFIAPPRDDASNQAIVVREDDETSQALKMIGQSIGIISLGKKLVLIEGDQGSLDKQTYGAILRDRFPKLVLVPSGGRALLRSFSTLNDSILKKTIWGVEFFILSDRDALPIDDPTSIENEGGGRIRVLRRYHLENYFLDENTIAKLFEPITSPGDSLRSPIRIRSMLKSAAMKHASYAVALSTAAHYRELVGNVDLMAKGCNDKSIVELVDLIQKRLIAEKERVETTLDLDAIRLHAEQIMEKIAVSFREDTDDWKALIPGKPVLRTFCADTPLKYENLRTAFINLAPKMPTNPFQDIINVFSDFNDLA